LRWSHATPGDVGLSVFVPIAEKSHLTTFFGGVADLPSIYQRSTLAQIYNSNKSFGAPVSVSRISSNDAQKSNHLRQ
jgi:EAL domain-containing protein (putative c-di-GMP-specific phosphodiesterase class I)